MIEKEFKEHRIWSLLGQIDEQINTHAKDVSADEKIDDMQAKSKYARWVLESSNSGLFTIDELNLSANELQNILSKLRQFPVDQGQIAKIYASFFSRIPYPRIQKMFKSDTNEAIDAFQLEIRNLQRQISERSAEFENGAAAVKKNVGTLQSDAKQIEEMLREIRAQSASQAANWEASASAQLTQKVAEVSEKFAQEQVEQQQRFQSLMAESSDQLSKMDVMANRVREENRKQRDDAMAVLGSKEKEFTEKADKVIVQLNNVLNAAGRDTLASDFAGNSVKEENRYFAYSRLSAGFFVLAALVLGGLWYSLAREENFTFIELFMRLPVSIVFLLPDFYFASQASDHRKSAIKLRSLGLRLNAFDTYLVNADVDEPERLKSDMADEFFRDKIDTREKRPIFGGSNAKLAEKLVDVLKDTVGKGPQ